VTVEGGSQEPALTLPHHRNSFSVTERTRNAFFFHGHEPRRFN
jgi:hypothetical protein